MSKVHLVRQGFLTKSALPSISRIFGSGGTSASLLLYGSAANGTTTFTDSSIYNRSISRVGSTQISNAQFPTGMSSSILFNGSTDYLTTPISPDFAFGSGDYTVEMWIYPTAINSYKALFASGDTFSSGNYAVYMNNGTSIEIFQNGVGPARTVIPISISTNTWYHLAITRQSGTVRVFVNGSLTGSATDNYSFTSSGTVAVIGRDTIASSPWWFGGYMSNVRIIKGLAVYTANFTIPKIPLANVSPTTNNATLLVSGAGANNSTTFIDNSINNLTVTGVGSTIVSTANRPTGMNSSILFDGNNDYLSIPYSSLFNVTGDFTIELWVNFINLPTGTYYGRLFSFGTFNAANTFGVEISTGPGTPNRIFAQYNGTGYPLSGNNAVTTNTWYHIAIVRSGSVITCYLNGTATGTITGATAAINRNQPFYIASLQGFETDPLACLNGYISNFRYFNGLALYTSNFTVPALPLTPSIGSASIVVTNNIYGVYKNR